MSTTFAQLVSVEKWTQDEDAPQQAVEGGVKLALLVLSLEVVPASVWETAYNYIYTFGNWMSPAFLMNAGFRYRMYQQNYGKDKADVHFIEDGHERKMI